MAKQTDTNITGTVGDVIFYKWKGIPVSRAKGNTGKQAPIAKVQAATLGKASAISAKFRAPLKPIIPSETSRKLMYRFNNLLQQWLRTNPNDTNNQVDNSELLNGFSFYEENEFGNKFYAYTALPVNRTDDNNLSISIPSFDSPNPIYPLPFSGEINLKITAVNCSIDAPFETITVEKELNFHYDGTPIPGQQILLPINTGDKKLTIVSVSINNMAAGIVGSFYN